MGAGFPSKDRRQLIERRFRVAAVTRAAKPRRRPEAVVTSHTRPHRGARNPSLADPDRGRGVRAGRSTTVIPRTISSGIVAVVNVVLPLRSTR